MRRWHLNQAAMKTQLRLAVLLWLAALLFLPGSVRADFALRDGDTVVFLGDSITAARRYDRVIENYTLLCFPERKVHFINAGKGGDTMAGGLARLDRDVFDRGATVLFVAFGFNDIGWGMHADAEHKQKYLDAIRGIVDRCRARKVRVFICSAAITSGDPDKAEDGFFQKMCDEGLALARSLGASTVEVQRGMREIQRRILAFNATFKDEKGKVTLHAADGVHLGDLGQLAMGFTILKGIGAPADVSSVTVDAGGPKLLSATGARVTSLRTEHGAIEFDRLDAGSPLNFGTFGELNFRFVPVPQELNRYMLSVTNLAPGRYEVIAGGRGLGAWDARVLAKGVNLSSSTTNAWEPGGLWDAQAAALKMVTDARYEVAYVPTYNRHFLQAHPELNRLQTEAQALNAQIETYQRALARPVPIRFIVRKAGEKQE